MAKFRCTGRSRGGVRIYAPPLDNPGSATAVLGWFDVSDVRLV